MDKKEIFNRIEQTLSIDYAISDLHIICQPEGGKLW